MRARTKTRALQKLLKSECCETYLLLKNRTGREHSFQLSIETPANCVVDAFSLGWT